MWWPQRYPFQGVAGGTAVAAPLSISAAAAVAAAHLEMMVVVAVTRMMVAGGPGMEGLKVAATAWKEEEEGCSVVGMLAQRSRVQHAVVSSTVQLARHAAVSVPAHAVAGGGYL